MDRRELTQRYLNSIESKYDGIIVKDLKTNFEKYILSENLQDSEVILLLLALSKTLGSKYLTELAIEYANNLDMSAEIIEEALEAPGIAAMLNTYHKFRHFIYCNDERNDNEYGSVGLRMGVLSKAKMPQVNFEIIFIAISILNSCEKCVIAHENHAISIGVSRAKIHDAVRLTAILKGLHEVSKL